jgi:hypothetical protein
LTVAEFAKTFRVGPDKVRAFIRAGVLRAVNVAVDLAGKPRWVITSEAVAAFLAQRQVAPPPPLKRRRRGAVKDYFPNV